MRKKILIVFGTRPEAIKMAPLVKELKYHNNIFETIVCVTGQHREMLDQVLELFEILPDYDLNLMKKGQDLSDITVGVINGMKEILLKTKPDIILVHGDTSTSFATALTAFYHQTCIGHIEAGLRTNNIYSPFPEELNRQITSKIAQYHFCPTRLNKSNLVQEGYKEENLFVTGNTVIDALIWVLDKIKSTPGLECKLKIDLINFGLPATVLESSGKIILITGHRRENFGEGFINICTALYRLAQTHPEVDFIYPMHLNPNVRTPLKMQFGDSLDRLKNVHFIEPLEYLHFVYLMYRSYLILTDSGGVQEEAPGLGKPVLVMRDTTERPEALESGTVKLVGTNEITIFNSVNELLTDDAAYLKMSQANNPYGDGTSSKKVVDILIKIFQ